MSEQTLERRIISGVQYRKSRLPEEYDSLVVEEWKKGKAVVSRSEDGFSFAFNRQDVGSVKRADLLDIATVALAAARPRGRTEAR